MADRTGRISLSVYRTVTLHLAVLVAMVERWGSEKRAFERSDLAHPEKRGWEKEPGSLRNLPAVIDADRAAVDEPVQSGRHSKGEAA